MPRESWGTAAQRREIGDRLRATREQAGLSQRQLSVEAGVRGVSAAYISRIEAGDRMPSLNCLRALAGPLGTTMDYLENGETNAIEYRRIHGHYPGEPQNA